MSCHCVLSGADADFGGFNSDDRRVARKEYRCGECCEPIRKGERYEHATCFYDGTFYRYRTCLLCVEIRTFFSCDGGWIYGNVWSDLMDCLFPEFHHGCLEVQDDDEKRPLSAAAKLKVVERWRKWKGFAA